ncbi:hypothetical protein DFJ77DRAFT_112009 [Powellomyces hirtus]|nr:hypothetical protein DFJ77DRAFT_112009 [Powellomyces hirtus]
MMGDGTVAAHVQLKKNAPTHTNSDSDTAAGANANANDLVDPLLTLTKTAPRAYQLELLEKAKQGNVIAVVDTGAGKTLVSVLLIKHMLMLEEQRKKRRPCVFLVPLVPLVLQQEAYIRHNCSAVVRHYYGAMGVDEWPLAKWKCELEGADVMVMTADIFKLLLHRAYLTIADVSLVIFDEAHHARKNHAYNQIMAIHYNDCQLDDRPKIFGMTASPTSAKEDSKRSITQLEKNLNSKAFTVAAGELDGHVNRATEEVKYYRGTSDADPPALFFLLSRVAGAAFPLFEANLKDSLTCCEYLGPWCAERALEQAIVDADVKLKLKQFQRMHNEHLRVGVNEETESAMAKSVSNLKNYIMSSSHWEAGGSDPTLEGISPKVAALIQVLEEYRSQASTFCGMVFVERRSTATVLCDLLKKWKSLDFLKCAVLVGHGTGGHNPLDENMSIPQQHRTMQAFRNGDLNLLVATRVGEEGLDIKACMLVIRFDGGGTLTNHIQARGRARHADSRYIILADELNPMAVIDGASLQRQEQIMRQALKERDGLASTEEPFDPMLKLSEDEIFYVKSTGASITLHTAISALFHYCALLPQDTFIDAKPIFQVEQTSLQTGTQKLGSTGSGRFIASVKLPMSAPMQARYVQGRPSTNKTSAKRWAAFEAVKRLYELGELDEHLKPVKIMALTVDDEIVNEAISLAKVASLPKTEKKRAVKDFTMGTPVIWKGDWKDAVTGAWLTKIKLRTSTNADFESLEFGFLTIGNDRLPRDTFSISFGPSDDLQVSTVPFPSKVDLDQDALEIVKTFHSTLFKGMLRSDVPDIEDWAIMVVPLCKPAIAVDGTDASTAIDWDVVREAAKGRTPVSDSPGFLDRTDVDRFVLYDRVQYCRIYLIEKVLTGHSPISDLPYGANNKFPNVASFYEGRLGCTEEILCDQPIVSARILPYITQSIREKQSMAAAYLIPQFCEIYPIPARLLQGHALHLPMIIQQLQLRLLATDLKFLRIDDTAVDEEDQVLDSTVEDLQCALTAPAANAYHNYERLETFGDSFLKVHQTLHLFATQPSWHEGHLSEMRNQLERNSALRARASKLNLERFIFGTPLSRKAWVPPMQDDRGGTPIRLSDKSVADVVEALIGACVATGGTLGGAKAIKKILGGSYEVDWSAYMDMLVKAKNGAIETEAAAKFAKVHTKTIRKVEQRIGYEFAHPSLAVEAITHASALQLACEVDCYQRLEFLGDAVLHFVVTRHLFLLLTSLTPGQLTLLRSELVNNQFLACVAWSIQLPQILEHMDAGLAGAIAAFGDQLDTAHHAQLNNTDNVHDKPLFWNSLHTAPKAAGDVYEAMLGAVFMDSGFDVEAIWTVVEKTLIKPWWNRFVAAGLTAYDLLPSGRPLVPTGGPMQQVSEWAQMNGCKKLDSREFQDPDTKAFTCIFTFHGHQVGRAGPELNKRGAKRIATQRAMAVVPILYAQGICDCKQTGGHQDDNNKATTPPVAVNITTSFKN